MRGQRNWKSEFGSQVALETLEERTVLAAAALTPGVTFEGTTLRIVTGDGADNVVITDDGAGNISAEITTEAGEILTGGGEGVTRVYFSGKGDDTVSYTATGAITAEQLLFFSLGRDGASVDFDFSAGVEGKLNAVILGGRGDDAVHASFGDISGKVRFGSELGGGSDAFDLTLEGDLAEGARAAFAASTFGTGNFAVAAEEVDIAADAVLALVMNGGRGADAINLNYSGLIDGTLHVLEAGGWGDDTLAAQITVNEGSIGSLNAAVLGGFGDDTQTLNVFDNSVPPAEEPASDVSATEETPTDVTPTETGLAHLRAVVGDVFGDNTLTHTENVTVIEPIVRPWFPWPRRRR